MGILFGKRIIERLQLKQVGEIVRDLGLEGQMNKQGTPTMGGLIILGAILLPTLLFADLTNVYTQLMILSTLWLGTIGFIDDYIKVFKKNKEGLAGRFKVIGQVGMGVILGATMIWHPDIAIKELTLEDMNDHRPFHGHDHPLHQGQPLRLRLAVVLDCGRCCAIRLDCFHPTRHPHCNCREQRCQPHGWHRRPGDRHQRHHRHGPRSACLRQFQHSHRGLPQYHVHPWLRGTRGVHRRLCRRTCVAFLWYNAFPAQVFMGDTGSPSPSAASSPRSPSPSAKRTRLIPVLCGIFLIENLSVVLQVAMVPPHQEEIRRGPPECFSDGAPLHHHYQKGGMPESKITARFWIVGILLAVVTIVTLKVVDPLEPMNLTEPILILGAGESGVGSALLAKALGARAFVSEAGEGQGPGVSELQSAGIECEVGGHQPQRWEDTSVVVKSPGIPDTAPVVQTCISQGREVISEIEYASRAHRAMGHNNPVVAVTGANGKTTTTAMIDHLLRNEGWDTDCVGNIGTSWARRLSERLTHNEAPAQATVLEVAQLPT